MIKLSRFWELDKLRLKQVFIIFLLVFILSGLITVTAFADHAGDALLFDGVGEYVRLGDTGVLMGGASWQSEKTVSLWIKPGMEAAPATDPPSGELIVGIDYPQIFGINRANFNGQDRIWIWNADSNGFDVIGVPYTSGEWMHLAVVHSGGVLQAYRNGVLVGTRASGTTYAPANGQMYLGGSGRSAASRYFGGEIDEVRFWNIGIGSAEIADWWDQEITNLHPNWSNLASYYQMSDGAGVVLTDDSGNGKTGDLLGGMGDANWVASGALGHSGPTATPTVEVPTSTPTVEVATATPTWTATAVVATATAVPPSPTPTDGPATATPTPEAPTLTPTATAVPPTPTSTQLPPTPTQIPPTPTQVTGGTDFALSFDGNNDFVELAETAYIMDSGWEGRKTISLWVRPNGSGTECAYNDVANCDSIFGDRPRWWGITRGIRDGVDRIWIWNADASSNSFIDMIGIEYTPDEWVHIAFVHENGVIIAYKNGVVVGSMLSGNTLQPYTGGLPVLNIGGVINSTSANVTFDGEIDEVKIWSVARTEAQIQDGMYQILTGSEPGLSAYYRMSNGSGLILTDDSINSWNGTLYDGARGVPPDGSPPQWVTPGPF